MKRSTKVIVHARDNAVSTGQRYHAEPAQVVAARPQPAEFTRFAMVDEVWCRVTVVGAAGSALASWPLSGPGAPDVGVVDRLARLRLAARRRGGDVLLSGVAPELAALIDLAGLGEVLRCSSRKAQRQVERREDVCDVEEKVERFDPPG